MGPVLELARGLSDRQLAAIADLEARCHAADGGRLKLEWTTLRSRDPDQVRDALRWDGDRLVGFAGVYSFGDPPEVTGMVDPAHRRRGIGSTLLDAALGVCAGLGAPTALLVVPDDPPGGRLLALARGGSFEYSEHALQLLGPPRTPPEGGPDVALRRRTPADDADVARLLAAAFDRRPPVSHTPEAEAMAARDASETWLVTVEGRTVGCLRLSPVDGGVGVYGFAVDPALQGRGIGRRALAAACRAAFADGAALVHLEVAVDNEHALGLYTSLGFRPTATEEYYRLAG